MRGNYMHLSCKELSARFIDSDNELVSHLSKSLRELVDKLEEPCHRCENISEMIGRHLDLIEDISRMSVRIDDDLQSIYSDIDSLQQNLDC